MALLASVSEVSRAANDQAHYQHELEMHSQQQNTSLLHLQPLNRPRAMNAATIGSATSLMRAHYNSKKNTELKLQQEFQKRAEETGRLPPPAPEKKKRCAKLIRCRRMAFALFDDPNSSIFAKILNLFIMSMIILSTLGFIIETLPVLHRQNEEVWFAIETFVVAVFTVEYVVRLCTCPKLCKHIIEPLNVIDLLAILPYYIELVVESSDSFSQLRVLRTVRLVRIFRIFKLSRYSSSMKIFVLTMTKSADALGLLVFYLVIAVILFSSIMYYIERGDYDDALGYYVDVDGEKSDFQSIPGTFWWCMVTITTVGYGDVVPKTWLGRCVAMVAMVAGILVMSFPISVIGATFSDMWVEANRKKKQEKIEKLKAKEEEKISMEEHITNLGYHIVAMKTHKRELEDLFVQAHHLIRTRTKNGHGANKALGFIETIALKHVNEARISMDKLKDYLENLPIDEIESSDDDDDDENEGSGSNQSPKQSPKGSVKSGDGTTVTDVDEKSVLPITEERTGEGLHTIAEQKGDDGNDEVVRDNGADGAAADKYRVKDDLQPDGETNEDGAPEGSRYDTGDAGQAGDDEHDERGDLGEGDENAEHDESGERDALVQSPISLKPTLPRVDIVGDKNDDGALNSGENGTE